MIAPTDYCKVRVADFAGVCEQDAGCSIAGNTCQILTPPRTWVSAYSTSCFSGFVPTALAQAMLRMTSGSPTPNDQRMPKCSAT